MSPGTRRDAELSTMRAVSLHLKARSMHFDHDRDQYCELQYIDWYSKPKVDDLPALCILYYFAT